ncbi:uncharacterized protein LOC119571201, partial [Penaeus monodon]|uniref:uncharacterized protein LOC119571201 n=1 Tax=Penaeus monodon TaxID=6687 RepID=UPI0018A71373
GETQTLKPFIPKLDFGEFVSPILNSYISCLLPGFVSTTWFRLGAAANVSPSVFFPVLNSSALFEIGIPIKCDCQVAWIRLSSLLPRTTIRCATETSFVMLQDVDEANLRTVAPSAPPKALFNDSHELSHLLTKEIGNFYYFWDNLTVFF